MAELKLQQSRLDGRYDIIECLGRGSYAEIYVARDNAAAEGGPTTVVIKALNTFLQGTPDLELERTLVENFQNEAVALDRVRHPHIISRLGHGTAIDLAGTTFHYIVLEYMPGGDMAAFARQRALPIDQALFYLEQVSSGLANAHASGVIHRDIKPQNLLLSADKRIVKIADFGVARLEATEGAITRVGTNIYAAPEHNPLVQTGPLDTGALHIHTAQLTPAADIYSLGKTTYTLLAGEAPRRFAQHPIKELPEELRGHYWAHSVLRVLEKATTTNPLKRYQTVQEFWDDLADAALPPTQPLRAGELSRRPSADLSLKSESLPSAPPQARFRPIAAVTTEDETGYAKGPAAIPNYAPRTSAVEPERWPKIVVPVSELEARQREKAAAQAAVVPVSREAKAAGHKRRPVDSSGPRPYIVAAILILAFVGMLLATHKYVTSQWNPFARASQVSDVFVIGREGVTTTDVNLRPSASAANPPVGVAENGSRVKILATEDNWFEVQVLEHGRPKADPFTSDRGWINKRFVRFD
ncbi:MAG TPA: serine/threonine protein kinase [Pyrinomonadaceae bacterium]|nr:serine/threonine protein kinase [Pyrinomonadaceae bacterium]